MPALVSIIIPTFNRAHVIEETLDAIVAQTYKNWECIVVDDGSTDTTKSIIASYLSRDPRFQFFSRPASKPKGANACRNYGFEKSKGEYIQWFDSDDVMHPDKLKIKIDYAHTEHADIVVATHTTETNSSLPENPIVEVFESSDFYVEYILGKKPVITNDVMVKRSVIGAHRFDEKLHKAQEYEFFTRLFEQKLTYCFVNLPLSFYRESEDSISKNTSRGNVKQVESLIYLSKLMGERHKNHPRLLARAERLGRKMYKNVTKRKNLKLLLKNFTFFRKAHRKGALLFFFFMCYNLLTGRGFDRIKPKTP